MRGSQFSLGVFEPGRLGTGARLHRVSPGPKLLWLLAVSAVTAWIPRHLEAWAAAQANAASLLMAVLLIWWSGFSLRHAVRWAAPAVWMAAFLLAFRWIGPRPSLGDLGETTAQGEAIVVVVMLARLFVATTQTTVLIDAIVRWLGPLRRVGAKPQTFALAVSLVIRSVPVLAGSVDASLSAHRARGLKPTAKTLLTPVGMSAVAQTIAMSEALTARMLPAQDEGREDAPAEKDTDS